MVNNIWSLNNIIIAFTSRQKIYELIPTNYTDGFRSNLTTDQIKEDYQNEVNNDFINIINILTEYNILMDKRALSTS